MVFKLHNRKHYLQEYISMVFKLHNKKHYLQECDQAVKFKSASHIMSCLNFLLYIKYITSFICNIIIVVFIVHKLQKILYKMKNQDIYLMIMSK